MSELGNVVGKTFLITGASRGLGALYAELFLKDGAKSVAIVDVAEDTGNATAEKLNQSYPGKVSFVKCDISKEEDIKATFDQVVAKFGTLDVLVNNAGIMNDSPQVWRKMCEVNYIGLVSFTLKALEHMNVTNGGKGGTIINVASIVALSNVPTLPIYAGLKAGVLHFSRSISDDTLIPFSKYYGVRVLIMCFGPTATDLLTKLETLPYTQFPIEYMTDIENLHKQKEFQSPLAAAKGLVDMFKCGSNGSIWVSIDNKPNIEITSEFTSFFDTLNAKCGLQFFKE